jgi:hypothetical protein
METLKSYVFSILLVVTILNAGNFSESFQTVDIVEEMDPKEFWSLLPDVNATFDRFLDPWDVDLIRYYFFANCHLYFDPSPTINFEKTKRLKKTVGVEGFTESQVYIALDILYHPIVSSNSYHARFGDTQLFPRWSGLSYMSWYYPYIFSHSSYFFYYRSKDLADFGLYAQYDEKGRNRFLEDYYRSEWEIVQTRKDVTKWRYGWPDWRIETWVDAYNYSWIRFEPDHHCLSGGPVFWLTKWYELTGEEKYLDAAYKYLYYQVPRFGFHKGVWKGIPYYWTGYDPGYPSFPNRKDLPPGQDATNNVQALVAKGLAAVGYHTKNRKMLEMARGLLWYLCRSFEIDGRWWYDGPENPLAKRKYPSHEEVCVSCSMDALTYLYKAGIDVEHLIKGLEPAIKLYTTHHLVNGELRPVSPDQLITAYKMMSTSNPTVGSSIFFATIFQVRLDNVTEVWFSDKIPGTNEFEYNPAKMLLKLYVWKRGRWMPLWENQIKAEDLSFGIKILKNPGIYEIYMVEYGPLKPKTTEFNLASSMIRAVTSSGVVAAKASINQQPEYHMNTNSTSFLHTIALVNFPKHPTDPVVIALRKTFLNLLPKPLLTSEDKAKFLSQDAKKTVDKALEEWRSAQAAFSEGRLEDAKNHLEDALNLLNEAIYLDHNYSRVTGKMILEYLIGLIIGGILIFFLKKFKLISRRSLLSLSTRIKKILKPIKLFTSLKEQS